MGNLDEALYETTKAQELDPLSPRLRSRIGQVLYYRRQYNQAIEQYKQVLRTEPNYFGAMLWLAFAYVAPSKTDEALRVGQKWKERVGDYPNSPGFTKGMVALFYAHAGQKEEANAMIKEAIESDPRLMPAAIAYWHTAVGNIDLAFEYLEKAYEARDELLFDIKVDPLWDPLRSDPRFAVLLQKLHLL
jgi:tetratricopeptide (TPR) repeat protein